MRRSLLLAMLSLLGAIAANVHASERLSLTDAWIRSAPIGAMMLAGYATLRNDGDTALVVVGADSVDFGDVSLHQSFTENGIERMRPLGHFAIDPGSGVAFAPGGRHFMLMQPKRELKAGDKVKIHIDTDGGDGVTAEFVVADAAPAVH